MVEDVFDTIMGKSNKITGNKKSKGVYYALSQVYFQ